MNSISAAPAARRNAAALERMMECPGRPAPSLGLTTMSSQVYAGYRYESPSSRPSPRQKEIIIRPSIFSAHWTKTENVQFYIPYGAAMRCRHRWLHDGTEAKPSAAGKPASVNQANSCRPGALRRRLATIKPGPAILTKAWASPPKSPAFQSIWPVQCRLMASAGHGAEI